MVVSCFLAALFLGLPRLTERACVPAVGISGGSRVGLSRVDVNGVLLECTSPQLYAPFVVNDIFRASDVSGVQDKCATFRCCSLFP